MPRLTTGIVPALTELTQQITAHDAPLSQKEFYDFLVAVHKPAETPREFIFCGYRFYREPDGLFVDDVTYRAKDAEFFRKRPCEIDYARGVLRLKDGLAPARIPLPFVKPRRFIPRLYIQKTLPVWVDPEFKTCGCYDETANIIFVATMYGWWRTIRIFVHETLHWLGAQIGKRGNWIHRWLDGEGA